MAPWLFTLAPESVRLPVLSPLSVRSKLPVIFPLMVCRLLSLFVNAVAAPRTSAVLMMLAPVPLLKFRPVAEYKVIEEPPLSVMLPACWKVMLLAAWSPVTVGLKVMLPLDAPGAATKNRSSDDVVTARKVLVTPAGSLFHTESVPQILLSSAVVLPAPAVVPLPSQ